MIFKFWNKRMNIELNQIQNKPQFRTKILRLFNCWSSISLNSQYSIKFANWNLGEMANKEFEVLALDGHNFPTCAIDIKVSLSRCGLYTCLSDLETSTKSMIEKNKYEASYIIRNHIHPDLKSEYKMEENPRALWNILKQRYEQ
ncbi:hypothetical protein PVAP13_8KG112401 [Panicum virgatum]|uniref:Uncharacterized protein n=1 Tax=Panicum virgatum TaxID=38727 RepID=A0A8T0PNH3_PANVG|nr:hypothetical protein PVAP13_8KG112401 [Panicum virgatum]